MKKNMKNFTVIFILLALIFKIECNVNPMSTRMIRSNESVNTQKDLVAFKRDRRNLYFKIFNYSVVPNNII